MATIARGVAVSRPSQPHATRVSARNDSLRGTASSLASRVKIANIDANRGSQACRALSILSSARCWQAHDAALPGKDAAKRALVAV
jgi:hypothetical protein